MNCLLDTCTFLWLTDHVENLSTVAREVLENPANTLILSQVSSIEIQIKYQRGRLSLGVPPAAFIREAIRRFDLEYLSLSDEHIWSLGKLPAPHRDPFDRLIIAQALHEGMSIVTPDPQIHAYPIRVHW